MKRPGLVNVSPTSFQYLKSLRDALTGLGYRPKSEIQKFVAPYEHEAFAREWVQDDWKAAPALAVATPAYAGLKAVGWKPNSTPPSLAQVGAGYKGLWQGLKSRYVTQSK